MAENAYNVKDFADALGRAGKYNTIKNVYITKLRTV